MDKLRDLKGSVDVWETIKLSFFDQNWEVKEQEFTYEQAESQFFKLDIMIYYIQKDMVDSTPAVYNGEKKLNEKQKANRERLNKAIKDKKFQETKSYLEKIMIRRSAFIRELDKAKPEWIDKRETDYEIIFDKYEKLFKSKKNKKWKKQWKKKL